MCDAHPLILAKRIRSCWYAAGHHIPYTVHCTSYIASIHHTLNKLIYMCYEIIMTCNLPVRSMLACLPAYHGSVRHDSQGQFSSIHDIIERWNERKRFVEMGNQTIYFTTREHFVHPFHCFFFCHLFSFFFILTNKLLLALLLYNILCVYVRVDSFLPFSFDIKRLN